MEIAIFFITKISNMQIHNESVDNFRVSLEKVSLACSFHFLLHLVLAELEILYLLKYKSCFKRIYDLLKQPNYFTAFSYPATLFLPFCFAPTYIARSACRINSVGSSQSSGNDATPMLAVKYIRISSYSSSISF
jgi:hypothetical protein